MLEYGIEAGQETLQALGAVSKCWRFCGGKLLSEFQGLLTPKSKVKIKLCEPAPRVPRIVAPACLAVGFFDALTLG